MRLRPLTEAECYARCYGGRSTEGFVFVHTVHDTRRQLAAISDRDRELIEQIGGRGGFDPRLEAA